MILNPIHEKKLRRKIWQFIYINCPFLVVSSALVYTPLLRMMVAPEKFDMVSKLMTMGDFLVFFDSFMIFGLVSKLVTSIVFRPAENKFDVTYLGKFLFQSKTESLSPKEITKGRVMNPFVEYVKSDGS